MKKPPGGVASVTQNDEEILMQGSPKDNPESMREKSLWQEYGRRKALLKGLSSEQYDEQIKQILKELGI